MATVSRALNPETSHLVSDATRHVVEEAVSRLGYRPNEAARSLRTRRSLTIGVVIPDITNPLFPRIVRGIDDALRDDRFVSLLANTDGDADRADDAIDRLLLRGVEGLILATASVDDGRPLALTEQGVPLVLLNRRVEGTSIPSVTPDGRQGTFDAIASLIRGGHRNLVVVAAPLNTSTGREKLHDVQVAAQDLLGHELTVVRAVAVSVDAGITAGREVLDLIPRPTAVIAANDLLALGAIQAIRSAGLACPADVSVVGFNNMPFSELMNPPLSTIGFDNYLMGREAARLLLQQIDGVPVESVRLEASWIERQSTAPRP